MTKTICIRGGKLLRNHELISEDLWIAKGKITTASKADKTIEARGLIVAPGYIDLQLNGAFGIDFTGTPEKMSEVAKKLPQFGVTSFLPTVISSAPILYPKIIQTLNEIRVPPGSAHPLGIHLEGPFLNHKLLRAHRQVSQQIPEDGHVDKIYGSLQGVKVVTLDPELPHAAEAVEYLKSKGIKVAAGHTAAQLNDIPDMDWITHFFNAMGPFNHRHPGAFGKALIEPLWPFTIIVDGVHVHPSFVLMAWRLNKAGLTLITDGMAAMGLQPGDYQLGGQTVEVHGRTVFVKGTTTLAGSCVSMDQAVRNLKAFTNCTPVEALEAASLKPATLLGIEKQKGTLAVGADADVILLDEQLNVKKTLVSGVESQ
jgi:N-acetylglucosamine-6-phosphate deacetylase